MHTNRSGCCALLLFSLSASTHAAILENVTPAADAFLSASNPANNYGGAGAIVISASGLPKGEFQSLLRFDLSAAKADLDANFGPGNWQITFLSLKLTATAPNNALFNGNATGPGGTNINTAGSITASWLANDIWTEGSGSPAAPGAAGINFNTLASLTSPTDQSLGSFAFAGGTSGQATYSLQVSAGLLADLNSGGLATLCLSAGDSQVSALFNSRTPGTGAPILSFTAESLPEPSTALLFSLGGLAALRRRRSNNQQ